MCKSICTWTSLLILIFLTGCATSSVDLPSPAASTPPADTYGGQASGTALPDEALPSLPEDSSPNPLPVIILTPQDQNSTPMEAVMTPATSEQNELVRLAIEDLAHKMDISSEEISLIDVASVVWPDGSLGCPQPGMFYTQALVEGARIRLQVGDQIYHYHSGRNQAPFLCENPSVGFDVTE
jgi:hypothetical protein